MKQTIIKAIFGAFILSTFAACYNPDTPAGRVGYCQRGAVVGKTRFYNLQTGPTSTGMGWLLSCTNVVITPITFDEVFKVEDGSSILSKDKLQISFAVHTVLHVRDGQVKNLMENYVTNFEAPVQSFYINFLQARLRTIAREELPKYDAFVINTDIEKISTNIEALVKKIVLDTPIEVLSVVVGNIQYPVEVANSVSKKIAAQQLLEQQETQLSIVNKQAEQRVAEARGISEAQKIINATLTTNYLQHEAIEAQKAMVGSPNHTTVYLPVGPMGVPIVGAVNLGANEK